MKWMCADVTLGATDATDKLHYLEVMRAGDRKLTLTRFTMLSHPPIPPKDG